MMAFFVTSFLPFLAFVAVRSVSPATELAAEFFQRRAVHGVVLFTCWEKEAVSLARLLAAHEPPIGVSVVDVVDVDRVRSVLERKSDTLLGLLADLACPGTLRFLHLASRLRKFTHGRVWVIFEDGTLSGENVSTNSTLSSEDETSIADVALVHFGPEAAGQPARTTRKVFLTERPPPARPPRLFGSMPLLLSEFGRRVLSPLMLFLDSDVTWVQRDLTAGAMFVGEPLVILVEVFRSSMARDLQVYLSAVAFLRRPVHWVWTMSQEDRLDVEAARYDLEGALIRATTVIIDMKRFTNFDDNRNRDVDIFPKVQYNVMRHNAQLMNFTMAVYQTSSYGWMMPNGSFDGLVGDLQGHLIDMGATGLFLRHDRYKYLLVTTELYALRTVMIFRQPPRSSVENIFILPFDATLWICIGSLAVIMIVVLALQTSWLAVAPPSADGADADRLSLPDVAMFVMGALCQQGASKVPETLSARITIVSLFLTALFIFTSYSASIVAILHAPSNAVHTVADLISSPIRVALHNMPYNKLWFEETDDPILKQLYKKKIVPYADQVQMSHTEGARRVRNGFFAIQIERNQVYKAISDTFLEHEKCDLFELRPFSTPYLLAIPVPRGSPYKDVLSQKLRWQHEVGLLKREHRRWETNAPNCGGGGGSGGGSGGGGATFVSIGLQEFLPALLLLQYGYLFALVLFLLENTYYRRHGAMRFCKSITSGWKSFKPAKPAVVMLKHKS